VIVLDHVTHGFGTRPALVDLSIRVEPGEVLAMIGLNGAGKTTALRILTGRLRPDHGEAAILDHDPADLPERSARRLGHVVGAPLAYPELTVTENVRSAARLHGLDRPEARTATTAAIERLDLGEWAETRASALSSGNHQRLGIACAIVHSPDVLVLDEPTSALDPRGIVVVRDLVRGLAAEGGAVLVSSHHLDEVSRVADRIVAVHAGRTVGTLEPGGTDLERRFFALVYHADLRTTAEGGTP